MPSYPLTALVLRKTKLGETDVILTLLAADGRQVRAVAKGLRKPGSRFGGRLEPYSVVDLLLHTGRSLEVVSEARTVASNAGLREDLDRSAAGAVVADLLDKISVEGQPDERLFGLATTSLAVFETASVPALPSLVVAFLLKAMAMHGYRPELDSCASCASELPEETRAFSLAAGGALCDACGSGDASAIRITPAARAWLTRLLGARMAEIPELEMPQAAVADCFGLLRHFIAYHVGARLRALDFYAGLLLTE